jgi:crossover junction endodeoxyribonuclease RuvC
MNIVMGIDPGINGAWGTCLDGTALQADDLPTTGDKKKRVLDASALSSIIKKIAPSLVVVESVHAMPRQGVSSTFRFGQAFGTIIGIVCALHIRLALVTPQAWKKYFGLTQDKNDSRQLAMEIMPDSAPYLKRKKDHNRGEALLLARYGEEKFTTTTGEVK